MCQKGFLQPAPVFISSDPVLDNGMFMDDGCVALCVGKPLWGGELSHVLTFSFAEHDGQVEGASPVIESQVL